MVKIGIIGAMRSGKDTFAEPLVHSGCYGLQFATGIKLIINRFFPQAYTAGKPREYYQHIGQSLRQLDPDVWVKDLEDDYQQVLKHYPDTSFIITDVRQPNEVQWCRDNGFTLVKIVTDEATRRERIEACGDQFEPEQFYHETELYVDEVEADIYVDGNVSIEQLQQKALEIYEQLKQEEC